MPLSKLFHKKSHKKKKTELLDDSGAESDSIPSPRIEVLDENAVLETLATPKVYLKAELVPRTPRNSVCEEVSQPAAGRDPSEASASGGGSAEAGGGTVENIPAADSDDDSPPAPGDQRPRQKRSRSECGFEIRLNLTDSGRRKFGSVGAVFEEADLALSPEDMQRVDDTIARYVDRLVRDSVARAVRNVDVGGLCDEIARSFSSRSGSEHSDADPRRDSGGDSMPEGGFEIDAGVREVNPPEAKSPDSLARTAAGLEDSANQGGYLADLEDGASVDGRRSVGEESAVSLTPDDLKQQCTSVENEDCEKLEELDGSLSKSNCKISEQCSELSRSDELADFPKHADTVNTSGDREQVSYSAENKTSPQILIETPCEEKNPLIPISLEDPDESFPKPDAEAISIDQSLNFRKNSEQCSELSGGDELTTVAKRVETVNANDKEQIYAHVSHKISPLIETPTEKTNTSGPIVLEDPNESLSKPDAEPVAIEQSLSLESTTGKSSVSPENSTNILDSDESNAEIIAESSKNAPPKPPRIFLEDPNKSFSTPDAEPTSNEHFSSLDSTDDKTWISPTNNSIALDSETSDGEIIVESSKNAPPKPPRSFVEGPNESSSKPDAELKSIGLSSTDDKPPGNNSIILDSEASNEEIIIASSKNAPPKPPRKPEKILLSPEGAEKPKMKFPSTESCDDLIAMSEECEPLPEGQSDCAQDETPPRDMDECLPQMPPVEEDRKQMNWKVGYLHVKLPAKSRGKAHLKAWKKRCVAIQPDEFVNDPQNPSVVVSVYGGESRKHKATFWQTVASRKAVVYRSSSHTHRYAFTIAEDSKAVIHLAGESESASQEWMAAVRAFLWPPSPFMQLEKMMSGREFEISLIDSEFSYHAGLLGMYGYLTITPRKLTLLHPQEGYVIQEWYLNTVDKFQLVPQPKVEDAHKVIAMTTCSDSSTGKGEILLFCNEAMTFLQSLASTIHEVLVSHSKQEGGKYQKELEEIAEWLVSPPQDSLNENPEAEEHYKVPPRQVKSLLDIPNFIFNKPLTPVASAIYPSPVSIEILEPLAKTETKQTSDDSGISTCHYGEDFLKSSTTSFIVGGGSMTGKSSDSEFSDSYTPPQTPEAARKKEAALPKDCSSSQLT